jgi:hypothetical protein
MIIMLESFMNNLPSEIVTIKGGARIGFVNSPFAKLIVTADKLTIKTTMFGLFDMGTYVFSRDQVLSIDRYVFIPLLDEGIRVVHAVCEYPQNIVFLCRPKSVLTRIAGAGFIPVQISSKIQSSQSSRGFPLRWAPILVLGVIWNALFGYEILSNLDEFPTVGILSITALLIVFIVSISAIRFTSMQTFLLKPKRHFGEIRHFFLLSATVTGFLAIMYIIMNATGFFENK